MLSQRRDFSVSNPVKACFVIKTFLYEKNILRTHNVFVETTLFCKQEDWKTPYLLH